MSIVRLRKVVTFERLLARLLVAAPDRWLLKGALALDFRLGVQARATLDMDLGRYDSADPATEDMLAAQESDLLDFFVFAIERTSRLDALREGSAVRYHVHVGLAGRTFENVIVDVGFSDPYGGRSEIITAPDLLAFAGMPPLTVPALALEYHVAEKFHAYSRGYSSGTIQSTRVKDLVDLVLISALIPVDAVRLRTALVQVFATRGLQALPSHLPHPPESWRQPYASMAKEVRIDPELATGHACVAAFLNPILAEESSSDIYWDPSAQRWQAPQGGE
jgi:hypothetical protein